MKGYLWNWWIGWLESNGQIWSVGVLCEIDGLVDTNQIIRKEMKGYLWNWWIGWLESKNQKTKSKDVCEIDGFVDGNQMIK